MPVPALAVEFFKSVGWGLLTNFVSSRADEPVMARLTAGKRLENHDLERALHIAFLQAQERICSDCMKRSELTGDDRLLLQQRLEALRAERGQLVDVQNVNPPLSDAEEIALLVTPSRPEVAADQQELARRLLAVAGPETAAGIPRQYRDRLQEQLFEWMGRYFMAQVKHEPVVFRALVAETESLRLEYQMAHGADLAEIKLMLQRLSERLCPVEPSTLKSLPVELKNAYYIERPALDTAIASGLAQTGIVALCGMGGVGKTQVAAHYATTNWGAYRFILWLHAEDELVLASQYAGLAGQLNLPVQEPNQPDGSIAIVRRWLEQASDWLLVFDNAVGLDALQSYLPSNPKGHVLITSRNRNWEGTTQVLPVEPFARADSVAFLQARTGKTDPDAADKLAAELGDLPLALAQAGAYVAGSVLTTLAGYLNQYRTLRQSYLNRSRAWGYKETVATTFAIAIDAVKHDLPAAKDLMHLCSFLGPDPIPLSLLTAADGELTSDVKEALQTAEAADRLLSRLCQYSLMDFNQQQRTLSVHRLVQEVVRDQLAEARRDWAGKALQVVDSAFTFDSKAPETWQASEQVLSQALAAVDHALPLGLEAEAGPLLNRIGLFLRNNALYSQAHAVFSHTLAIGEKVYGPDRPEVATVRNNLALVLQDLGDLAGARAQYERALAIDEKIYGSDHPDVATDRNNLGSVLQALGDLVGARAQLERALSIDEQVYGPDHPDVATDRNNLGSVLQALGDLAGARAQFERALAIAEKVYGCDHPAVATDRINLGTVLQALSDLAGARAQYERALAIDEQVYGPDHPEVATDRNNLGSVLKALGNLAGARAQFERALAIDEKVYGPDHPTVATLVNNLGSVLKDLGDLAGARAQYERALAIDEQVYGPDHPAVARDRNNLGSVLQDLGDLAGARAQYERALAIAEKVYGPGHPTVAIIRRNFKSITDSE